MAVKKISLLTVLLISSLILLSCANVKTEETGAVRANQARGTETAPKSSLDFRITWKDYSGRGEAIRKITDAYNKQSQDGCSITMTGGDEERSAIEKLISGNSNTVYVLPYRYVKYFGGKGSLCDLTAAFRDAENLFYPEIWKLGKNGDAVYGIPWLGHSMCLLYNKSLLNQAGVSVGSIKSLDALEAALKAVEEKTGARGIGLVGAESNDVSWMVNQFIYGFGSRLVGEDGKSVAINNGKSKAALDFYKNTLGKHAQDTWVNDTGVEVMTHFRNQKVAFEIQGIWGVTDIAKNGAPFEVGIIPLKDIGLCAEVGPMMLSLPAGMNAGMKEEAIKFIRYMISMEAQEEILNGEYSAEHDAYYPFRTPIRVDMADSRIIKQNPEYQTFIEGFQTPSIDVPVPAWETVKNDFYESGLHRVMKGEMPIDSFLEWIEAEGNKILANQ